MVISAARRQKFFLFIKLRKYVVELTSKGRIQLEELVKKGKVAGYKIRHAQMLLKADQGKEGPGWHDKQIADAFGAHLTSLERLRKRLVEEGLEAALERHKRQNYAHKLAPQWVPGPLRRLQCRGSTQCTSYSS